MFKYLSAGLVVLISCSTCLAQDTLASPEHEVLKQEVGEWEATITIWPTGPDGEVEISEGTETNKMMGNLWLISDFKSTVNGQHFSGHGAFGYDAEKKKYVGAWIDEMVPIMSMMEGEYDTDTKTMTYKMKGKGPDGQPQKTKLATVQKDADTRVMTMHAEVDGEFVKMLQISYKRKK